MVAEETRNAVAEHSQTLRGETQTKYKTTINIAETLTEIE